MKWLARALLIIAPLTVACPPPAYLDLFNNGRLPLTVIGARAAFRIEPNASATLEFRDAVHELRSTTEGTRIPILVIRSSERDWEYDTFVVYEGPFVHRYGSIPTWYLQVEADGTLLLVQDGEKRPISATAPQPHGFPVHPQLRAR